MRLQSDFKALKQSLVLFAGVKHVNLQTVWPHLPCVFTLFLPKNHGSPMPVAKKSVTDSVFLLTDYEKTHYRFL